MGQAGCGQLPVEGLPYTTPHGKGPCLSREAAN